MEKTGVINEKDRERNKFEPFSFPTYGLFGRESEVENVKNRLSRHNILLLKGTLGSGKTSFLNYLASQWHQNEFIKDSIYFSFYMEKYNIENIFYFIGKKLFNPEELNSIRNLEFKDKKDKVVKKLREERFCLIFDDFEISSHKEVENFGELINFVEKLSGGKSYIIISSKTPGKFFSKEIKQNTCQLKSIDRDAALNLAMNIAGRRNFELPVDDDNFKEILDRLSPSPLSMEIILPELKIHPPERLLNALRTSDIDFREESPGQITKCLDMAYDSFSEEERNMVLLLSPFEEILNLHFMENYINELSGIEKFKDIKVNSFYSLIPNLVDRGLMEPVRIGTPIMKIHKILSLFLKEKTNELYTKKETEELLNVFENHFNGVAGIIYNYFLLEDQADKDFGLELAGLEYGNLMKSLDNALKRESGIIYSFTCLSRYFSNSGNVRGNMELYNMILDRTGNSSKDSVKGDIGIELMDVLEETAQGFSSLGKTGEVKKCYLKSLDILKQNTVLPKREKEKRKADLFSGIAVIYLKEENFTKALKYYKDSLKSYIELNYIVEQADTYHTLGIINKALGENQKARLFLEKELEIRKSFKDLVSIASLYHELSEIEKDLGNEETAEKHLKEAKEAEDEIKKREKESSLKENQDKALDIYRGNK